MKLSTLFLLCTGVAGVAFGDVPDCFVEYVESDGNAWVDTGVKPVPSTFRATVALSVTQLKNSSFFGIKGSGWASTDSIYVYYGSSTFRLDWIGSQTTTFKPVLETVYRFDCRGNTVSIDGSVYAGSQTKSSSASTKNFWLMGVNGNGTGCVPQRLYGAQFYEDGKTLSANYIPCKKDGVAGLWDTISGQILYSASSTPLKAGPEISTTVKTFVSGSDLKWSTAANWQPAGVPTATDEVIIPAGRTVIADSSVTVKTLNVEPGAALSVGCELTKHLSADTFYPTADAGALSLSTTGDLTLKGVLAVGGRTNVYDSVTVAVGGNLMMAARSRAYLFARYGDKAKAWSEMTWRDFRAGGGTLTVAGKTTLADSAIIYPAAHRVSGLAFVFDLQDLEIGPNASFNANYLGWTYVGGTWYGKGANSGKGGAYGGAGGNGNTKTYGFAAAPFEPGSPGYNTSFKENAHPGGGAITIFAKDVVLDGKLTANGGNSGSDGSNYNHGGSGGGILLCCSTLTPGETAKITADGGYSNKHSSNYGGGGGRVAVITGDPTPEMIGGLYETGAHSDVKVVAADMSDANTCPWPALATAARGLSQSSDPSSGAHGKVGTTTYLAARQTGKVFVEIKSDKTPVVTTPTYGVTLQSTGDVSFDFPPYVVDAKDSSTRYVFESVALVQGGETVETVTDCVFTRNLMVDTVALVSYSQTQYLCKLKGCGAFADVTEWVNANDTFACAAGVAEGWTFVSWQGDVPEANRTATELSLTVDHPLTVSAVCTTEAARTANAWTGAGDGATWEDAANWSQNRIPGLNDDVTVSGATSVLVVDQASVGSLALTGGATLNFAAQGTSIANANSMKPIFAPSRTALGLTVVGDLTIDGAKIVLGGYRHFASDVWLEVGGNLTMSGASALVVYARYGAESVAAKKWNAFTAADFQKGGARVEVKGKTTLADAAAIYPTCHATSGLSPVFVLGDLEVGLGAKFDATARGWAFDSVSFTYYGKGYEASRGGAYGGHGGRHNSDGVRNTKTYGEPLAPFWPGSPGGGGNSESTAGGGAIVIRAANVALNGTLIADGSDVGSSVNDDGSGGSIFVVCDKLTPGASSVVKTWGGNGTGYDAGCGGGGRICIVVGGLEQTQLDSLYATGNCENIMVVIDDPAAVTDKTIYPNTINVEGGHGPKWSSNPSHGEHGTDGTFRWVQNRGSKVLLTVDAGIEGAVVSPIAGTDSIDRGEVTFTAPEVAADPDYPATGRYFVQGLVWSNATEGVAHEVSGLTTVLDIQDDTWVIWQWGGREFMLDLETLGPGTTSGAGWHGEGTTVTLTAQPEAGATFAYWAGDVGEADRKSPSISVVMDRPKRIRAVYSRSAAVSAIWKGAAKGDWFDAENWENGLVPTAVDDVTMTNGAAFVRDSVELEMASLTLTGAAKLYIGGTGTSARTSRPFDATVTNTWRLSVAGDIVITNGAQLVMGGHKGLAESEIAAANLTLVKGGQLSVFAGEHGEMSELDTFRMGGARVKVGGVLNITGSQSMFMVFNHYKSGAPVIVTAQTFALENGAVVDADYNGWGRWERTLASGAWSPVLYGFGVPAIEGDTGRAGASYGGKGGLAEDSTVYGAEAAPYYPGSPTHDTTMGTHLEYGGGSVRLEISDRALVDATIRARGRTTYNAERHGGSSGGSIWLTARKVKFGQNARLDVSGGNGGSYKNSSGGGGGRIAVGVRLDSARLDELYATGTARGITVSPLANNAKYPVSVNVAGGTCPSYSEGSMDGGAGSAVLVEGPTPGLMMIVR